MALCELGARTGAVVVLASSSEVYQWNHATQMREDDALLIGPSHLPRCAYAVSKLHMEHVGLAYWRQRGVAGHRRALLQHRRARASATASCCRSSPDRRCAASRSRCTATARRRAPSPTCSDTVEALVPVDRRAGRGGRSGQRRRRRPDADGGRRRRDDRRPRRGDLRRRQDVTIAYVPYRRHRRPGVAADERAPPRRRQAAAADRSALSRPLGCDRRARCAPTGRRGSASAQRPRGRRGGT